MRHSRDQNAAFWLAEWHPREYHRVVEWVGVLESKSIFLKNCWMDCYETWTYKCKYVYLSSVKFSEFRKKFFIFKLHLKLTIVTSTLPLSVVDLREVFTPVSMLSDMISFRTCIWNAVRERPFDFYRGGQKNWPNKVCF